MLVRTAKIDPKDYPFKKFIDEQAHLDTDELRHTIQPKTHYLTKDFPNQEHLYCDPSDLDANGKFFQCPYTLEAKNAGYDNPIDYNQAKLKKQKDDDDKQRKAKDDLIATQAQQIKTMSNDIKNLHSALNDLINTINKNKISQ